MLHAIDVLSGMALGWLACEIYYYRTRGGRKPWKTRH